MKSFSKDQVNTVQWLRHMAFGVIQNCIQIFTISLRAVQFLSKSLSFPEPWFSHLETVLGIPNCDPGEEERSEEGT